ncbi:MAG: hypothetical protein K2X87_30710 [Gemmataceae bacterium]|nr:hypothetical protein [Gemmataceae bacterium]
MTRRAALGLAAALAGPVVSVGCRSDRLLTGWDGFCGGRDCPRPTTPRVDIFAARRVDEVGRRILDQNTFTGLEPLFQTVGKPEPELFHRGTGLLVISEGLVRTCRTDAELAAVLCSELGAMMAEHRAAAAHGRDASGIRTEGTPAATGTEVGAAGSRPLTFDTTADADTLARQLLRGAGFDPAELDRVKPVLGTVTRGGALEKQMAGSAAAPTWEK